MSNRMRRQSANLWTAIDEVGVPVDNRLHRRVSAAGQSCATVVGNGRAQRFRKHRHGTDAQRAVLRPLGARPG